MFVDKKKLNKILSICIFYIISTTIITAFAYLENKINEEELMLIKKNGIVSGMCYVVDLISGKIAKAIMCIFIMATGWSYIKALKIEWKSFIPISIATALIFGGENIAKQISGNNYSCSQLNKLYETDGSYINNVGFCSIIDIPEYIRSQEWSKCNESETNCTQKINSNTSIVEGDIVSLTKCGNGFYLDKNRSLNYVCKKIGDKGEWRKTNKSSDSTICIQYCSINDLKKYFTNHNAYKPINSEGNIISINHLVTSNDLNNSIHLHSGEFTMEYQGVTEGTRLAIICNESSGYNEIIINNDGKRIPNTEKDKSQIKLECKNANYSIVGGDCHKSCKISNLKNSISGDYKYVSEWNVCKMNIYGKNLCETKTTEELIKESIPAQATIQIVSCTDNYIIQSKTDTAKFICENGEIKKIESISTEKNKTENTYCELGCNIENIPNYILTETITYPITGSSSVEYKNIENRVIFYNNETIRIDSCKSGSDIMKNELRDGIGKKLELAEFICKANGKWENLNFGEYCHKNCIISNFQELFIDYEKAKTLALISSKNRSELFKNNSGTSVYFSTTENSNIYNGEYVKITSCIDGYAIKNNSSNNLLYVCQDGEIKWATGSKKVCKKICSRKDIPREFDTVSNWGYCGTKPYDCSKDLDNSIVLYAGDYISAKQCKNGYSFNAPEYPNYTVIKCNEEGEWEVHNNGDMCIKQ